MSILDFINEILNPVIVEKYKELYNQHHDAIIKYLDKNYSDPNFKKNIFLKNNFKKQSYKSKEYIVNNIQEILKFNSDDIFYADSVKIINKFPHGFTEICEQIFHLNYINAPKMPSETLSNRKKRLGKEPVINRLKLEPIDKSSFTLDFLKQVMNYKEDIYIAEKKNVKKLEIEDIEIRFDNLILDNPFRYKYYKSFILDNNIKKDDYKKICLNNLAKLDLYISSNIEHQNSELEKNYKNGYQFFKSKNRLKDTLSYYDIEEIFFYESNYKRLETYKFYESKQNRFANNCEKIFKENGFEIASYSVDYNIHNIDGSKGKSQFKVCQSFINSFYLSNDIETTFLPNIITQKELLNLSKVESDCFIKDFSDKLLEILKQQRQAVIVFGKNDCNEWQNVNNIHFSYLIDNLEKSKDCYGEYEIWFCNINEINSLWDIDWQVFFIDVFTTHKSFYKNCKRLKKSLGLMKRNIAYISLFKEYSKEEIKNLKRQFQENELIKKRQKDAEEYRIKTIINAKKIFDLYPFETYRIIPEISLPIQKIEIAEKLINKENEIIDLSNFLKETKQSVFNWHKINGLPYYYFFNYYPIRFQNISNNSERIRSYIFGFKDGDENIQYSFKENLSEKLISTFGPELLKKITFVCIPASNKISNEYRYKKFSQYLCQKTEMINGFNYITIINEGLPSHIGGTNPVTYSLNKQFFQNKNVVIFDDVSTSGKSISKFQKSLEESGAFVICALTIGKTKNYYDEKNDSHPWDGNLLFF